MSNPPTTDVAIFSIGRKDSQRCPNKMLRPLAGTTLTDILLKKFARCHQPTFFAGYEPEFRSLCNNHGVRFVQRDERSATIDEPIVEILSFLQPLEFTHFLCVNGSLPFLELDTITSFLDDCIANNSQPAFSVIRKANHLMSLDRHPMNFDITAHTINTKTVTLVARCVLEMKQNGAFVETIDSDNV